MRDYTETDKKVLAALVKVAGIQRHQATVIACITSMMEEIMAGQAELLAAIAELKKAVADDQVADQKVVDDLQAIIVSLQNGADTSAVIASLKEIQDSIKTVVVPEIPIPTEPPTP